MKNFPFLLVFTLLTFFARAQYFQTGQDPASIRWRQINTENFQLIYPDYYEEQAQVLAQKLEKVYNYASYSLHHKPKTISILLHTQTVQSNGLVAYAPKRSEFYTTPNQAIYPLDWLEQLAVHEFRHVVQIDKVNSEMPGIIKLLLGEQGTALVFGAYLPWWFIEGDAVVTETALSNFGRGRFPSFLMEHRAQLVENGKYSYDKAYLGSYRNFVPNHYNLGYYLVANTRERYGSGVWEKVVPRVGKKPLSFTPFNSALKKETGFKKVGLYNSIFDSLATVWQSEDLKYKVKAFISLTNKPNTYTDYTFAHQLDNQKTIAYKTGLNQIPAFVMIDLNGQETIIHQPGVIFDESVNVEGDWMTWSEHLPNLRWSHSGFSLLRLLNVNTGQKIHFTPEFKAFAPAISPDLKRLAVVEADFSSNYYLTIYEIPDGKKLIRMQTEENNYLLSPAWENDSNIICVMLTNHGKRLIRFNLGSGKYEQLANIELGDIKHLRVKNEVLYFVASLSGKDAIYQFDLKSHDINRLYEPRFGAAYPDIDDKGNLIFSDYTADGYRLISIKNVSREPIELVERETYPLAKKMATQEMGIPDLSVSDTIRFQSETYSKPAHLLNFHSWAPVFVDPYRYEFAPGVSILSQNILGTAETVLGYKWDLSEKTGQVYASYIYKGWYPVLDFEVSSGKRASQYNQITEYIQNGNVVSRDTTLKRFTWNETQLSAAIKLPLNITRGSFYRLLQPEVGYEYTLTKASESTPSAYPVGDYHSMSYRLYFHQLLRQSYQDVWPNFGIILDASYYHSPFGSNYSGSELGGHGVLYLPGFLANHGIKLYAGAQDRSSGDHYSYSDIIRFPRGWARVSTKQLSLVGIDYKLPLVNPDLSIWGLTYIRRINTSVFYDYAFLSRYLFQEGHIVGTYNQNISSFGVEVIGDMNFLRFYAPVQIGVRATYLPEIQHYSFDFLISVNFNSL